MSAPVIAFFNNKSGVGKTSLVYHLAWMYAGLGQRVVAADLDPQANLTAAFLDEDRLKDLWAEGDHSKTIWGCLQPLMAGSREMAEPYLEIVEPQLALLAGDLALAEFEDEVLSQWQACLSGDERAFHVVTAFWRVLHRAAAHHAADVVLVDSGPNLGAINRAILLASDYGVVPLLPDAFTLQGLHYLGDALRRWRAEWQARLCVSPLQLELPQGAMRPLGYVVLRHSVRLDQPVRAYDHWLARIPSEYRQAMLDARSDQPAPPISSDPYCLAMLKHYRSLMPMAQEARKPMFALKPADGAIGAHTQAVQNAYHDFKSMAQRIAAQTGIELT